jgi:nitrite reductase/ring-hydroxylating ferredoxin subunit/uncharacterized membrane protein
MGVRSATEAITRQEWLTSVEETLQHGIHEAFRSGGATRQKIKNTLHGTWLGHPLHAALTDIPIGAWTAAVVFDVIDITTDRRQWGVAADASPNLGIIGALCAALAGLTDWQDTDPPVRRIGLMHGLLNIAGVGLFTGSVIARKRKLRALGRCLSALGYAVASTAARLGGNMVYEHRVGVDRTSGQTFPDHFIPVLAEPELRDGTMRRVEYQGAPILLARRGNRLFALAENCSHWGGPLSERKIIDDSVKCPWHGSRFALEDGRVLDGPAVHPQLCLRARIRNGQIEIGKVVTPSEIPLAPSAAVEESPVR